MLYRLSIFYDQFQFPFSALSHHSLFEEFNLVKYTKIDAAMPPLGAGEAFRGGRRLAQQNSMMAMWLGDTDFEQNCYNLSQ